jgi:NADH-quinone oxidoreductase subunit A
VPQAYVPVLAALLTAFALACLLMAISWFAGKRTGGRVKTSTYESGLPLLDRSRKRLSIAFFLIAIDFVVFDVEAAFLYPWVVVLRDGGWPLFWAVMAFLALILVGYAYVWKKGGLEIVTRAMMPSAGASAAVRRRSA